MHSYLRAIGFSDIKKGFEIKDLLKDVIQTADYKNSVKINENSIFIENSMSAGKRIGITLCGSIDDEGFHQEYYFPYFKGSGITTTERPIIEKRSDSDSFAGVCEDMRIGVSLIFYLQNAAEFMKEDVSSQVLKQNITTTFSGLSLKGNILLPICKTEEQVLSDREASKNRCHLLAEARKGNEDAIESLTIEDMDIYSMINRRIQQEDVFTIVDSYFMPFGIECDHYSLLGDIKAVEKIENSFTKEQIYIISLECNEIDMDICINEKDLYGEPIPGRRFKGEIWLQGHINYPQ